MNLKEVIAEAKEKAQAEAAEKNLDKDSTKKLIAEYIKEAKEKFETESPMKAKKYQVSTPTENFNGEVAGVQFAYGKAIVQEGWILNWFKEKGYEVEEVTE